jgi:hypothetical protein
LSGEERNDKCSRASDVDIGFEQADNAQAGVDAESLRVVTAEITQIRPSNEKMPRCGFLPADKRQSGRLLAHPKFLS